MSTNSQDHLQIHYSDPMYLYVHGGTDNAGNSNFGGYNIYVVKVPQFEVPQLSTSGLLFTQKLEHVKTIYPETDVSYSGRINKIGDNPVIRDNYSPSYIYPIEYYDFEEGYDHYFYMKGFDKDGNFSSGFISHSSNPFRGPSIKSRAIQFANDSSSLEIINSGVFFPNSTAGAYPSGTVSFWITTPNVVPDSGTSTIILEKLNPQGNFAPIGIHVNNSPVIYFYLGRGGTFSYISNSTGNVWPTANVLELNRKYHVAFVWSGVTSTTVKGTIYVNGLQDYSSTKSMTAGLPAGPTVGTNLNIGKRSSGTTDSWSGLILDGLHFWSVPFSGEQVKQLYSGQLHGIPWSYEPNNLYHKYSFDEGSGIVTYADYPIISPEISGVFSGDIRWVRPLYTELQQSTLNENISTFFDNYVTSGVINSGVIDEVNTNFPNRLFTSSSVKTEVESLNNYGVVANYKVPQSALSFAKTHGNLIPKAYSEFESVPTLGTSAGSPAIVAGAGYRGTYGVSAVASDTFYLGPSSSTYNISGLSPNGATLYFILSCMCYSTTAGTKADVTVEDSAINKFLSNKAFSDTVANSWTRVYSQVFAATTNNPIKIEITATATAFFDDFMLEQVNSINITEPGEFKPGDGKNSLPYTDFVSGELNYFTKITNGWGNQIDNATVRVHIGNALDFFTETTDSPADGPFLLLPLYTGIETCPLVPSGSVYIVTTSGYNGIWYSDGNGNCYDSLGYDPATHKEVYNTPISSYAKVATSDSEIERFLYFTTRR